MCLKGRTGKSKKGASLRTAVSSTEPPSTTDVVTRRQMPKDISIWPSHVTFYRETGKPPESPLEKAEGFLYITNKSEKAIAYKVLSSDDSIFEMDQPTGCLAADDSLRVTISYTNDNVRTHTHYFRVFASYLENWSDPIPDDFNNEGPPENYDGEHFMEARFSTGPPPTRIQLKALPNEIQISPETVTFNCGDAGKKSECGILIMNKSKKFAAFKVVRTGGIGNSAIFHGNPRSGVVAAGKRKCVVLTFLNKQEEKVDHYFFVFISLLDSDKLPDQFKGELVAPPTVFDGVKVLKVVFTKKAAPPEVVAKIPSSV